MTNREAFGLLAIERACVAKGSGMEAFYELSEDGCSMGINYKKVNEECDRNCAVCPLVQKSEDLLAMYDYMLQRLNDEIREEEQAEEWRDWQRDCDPRQPLAI